MVVIEMYLLGSAIYISIISVTQRNIFSNHADRQVGVADVNSKVIYHYPE
jgi:hypothetical protein